MVCVGLDSAVERIPRRFTRERQPQLAFNRWIIEQTLPYAAAYKPNLAFYEARGAAGWHQLAETMAFLRAHAPDVFTIADAKRADIGSTNAGYVAGLLDDLAALAVARQHIRLAAAMDVQHILVVQSLMKKTGYSIFSFIAGSIQPLRESIELHEPLTPIMRERCSSAVISR